jgi:hypothetical protein
VEQRDGCAYGILVAGMLWVVIFVVAAIIISIIARHT